MSFSIPEKIHWQLRLVYTQFMLVCFIYDYRNCTSSRPPEPSRASSREDFTRWQVKFLEFEVWNLDWSFNVKVLNFTKALLYIFFWEVKMLQFKLNFNTPYEQSLGYLWVAVKKIEHCFLIEMLFFNFKATLVNWTENCKKVKHCFSIKSRSQKQKHCFSIKMTI